MKAKVSRYYGGGEYYLVGIWCLDRPGMRFDECDCDVFISPVLWKGLSGLEPPPKGKGIEVDISVEMLGECEALEEGL